MGKFWLLILSDGYLLVAVEVASSIYVNQLNATTSKTQFQFQFELSFLKPSLTDIILPIPQDSLPFSPSQPLSSKIPATQIYQSVVLNTYSLSLLHPLHISLSREEPEENCKHNKIEKNYEAMFHPPLWSPISVAGGEDNYVELSDL